jgi:hypothetical protein
MPFILFTMCAISLKCLSILCNAEEFRGPEFMDFLPEFLFSRTKRYEEFVCPLVVKRKAVLPLLVLNYVPC